MNKPDWKDAPEWAQYLAMDENGEWYWYEQAPNARGGGWYARAASRWAFAGDSLTIWDETLEARP